MLGKYSYSTFLLDSDQHVRVLQNHLTPNLKTFLSRASEEMEYSFEVDVPRPNGTLFHHIPTIKVLLTHRS